jgi:micrococcal nuclease
MYDRYGNKISKLKLFSFILGCCLILLSGCQASSPPTGITAKVQRVVSGQTLEVLIPSEAPWIQQVRLLGISAPDLKQEPWGRAAKNRLRELVSGQKEGDLVLQSVLLELGQPDRDQFGRLLAYVWHDRVLINEQLVAQGYVLADEGTSLNNRSKYRQRLNRAQEYARLMGYGIWDPKKPIRLTPKEFRSKNSSRDK